MLLSKIDMYEFCDWLCQREDEVVGKPGMCYLSPLAHWMSEGVRATIGVDGSRYGRALVEDRQWSLLPRWAQLFTALSERWFARSVTGAEALDLLGHVEALVVSSCDVHRSPRLNEQF